MASPAGRSSIDFIDSKLNPNETRNATIKACADDFAMVGGEALFMSNVDDMVACKNAAGEAIGIPDVPGCARRREQCSPVSYTIIGRGPYCATKNDHPQTYLAPQGDALYYLKQNKDLHGIWLTPGRPQVDQGRRCSRPTRPAQDLGIKKDGNGFYDVFQRDPQSAMTPVVQAIKQNNSTFAYSGSDKMLDLRKEATIQGVTSVKVWGCTQACYSQAVRRPGRQRRRRHPERDHDACRSTPSTSSTRR